VKVAVVGGGVMGSATAWQLQRQGVEVTLYEQFTDATHVNGSSHGGSRIFRFAYEDPYYVRLAQAALGQWRELEEAAGEPLLDITGGVDHGPAAVIDEVSLALTAAGSPACGSTSGSSCTPTAVAAGRAQRSPRCTDSSTTSTTASASRTRASSTPTWWCWPSAPGPGCPT
jgi:glycine/D-amino acid oxidase-like deaminating enzyme